MTTTVSCCYDFSFGTGAQPSVGLRVGPESFFSDERGYGIVDARAVAGATTAEQALHNGGWNLRRSCVSRYGETLCGRDGGVFLADARDVLVYKVLVAHYGVYRVRVTVRALAGDICGMALFSGRRCPVARDVALSAGDCRVFTFYAVAAPYIPAFTAKIEQERALYVSITGENAGISHIHIEKTDAPVLWVAGDSTLTDQNALFPYYAHTSCAGWAQALPRYLEGMAVCNYAHSGMTSGCFRDDGHWELLAAHVRSGDAVLFQFGHNDQKRRNLAPFGGYSENLRRYVRETRALGAVPLIVSPISRIPFDDNGEPHSLLKIHALASAAVADELAVPFIDLHALTFAHWNAMEAAVRRQDESACVDDASAAAVRPHAATRYFMRGDITHTNDFGADCIAALAVAEIRRQRIAPLCDHLAATPAPFALADDAPSPSESESGSIFDIALPYIDAGTGETRAAIEAAFRGGLLDPCVLYVHPDATLPRAQLLMPLFKALRLSGKRPYRGAFDDVSRYEWDSGYVQACLDAKLIEAPATAGNAGVATDCGSSGALPTKAEFYAGDAERACTQQRAAVFATSASARFCPDEPTTALYVAMLAVRALEPVVDRRPALTADECLRRARALGIVPTACDSDTVLTRVECYGGLVRLMELAGSANSVLPSDMEQHPTV